MVHNNERNIATGEPVVDRITLATPKITRINVAVPAQDNERSHNDMSEPTTYQSAQSTPALVRSSLAAPSTVRTHDMYNNLQHTICVFNSRNGSE